MEKKIEKRKNVIMFILEFISVGRSILDDASKVNLGNIINGIKEGRSDIKRLIQDVDLAF